jgi:dTDP-4-dehydrorhamnose 3,5-epimerase
MSTNPLGYNFTMSRFDFIDTPLEGLKTVQRKPIEDNRGFFSRFYCKDSFKGNSLGNEVLQINHSFSKQKGTVRGMHFQLPPYAETKYVSCIKGEIFDVAVDLRKNSPTFLHWHGEILSEHNQRSLIIPEGFAHGFQTIEEDCELLYLVSNKYEPAFERALNPTDPLVSINWPLLITEISDKDKNCLRISKKFKGLELSKSNQEVEYLAI